MNVLIFPLAKWKSAFFLVLFRGTLEISDSQSSLELEIFYVVFLIPEIGTQLRFIKKESVHKLIILTVLASLKSSEFLSLLTAGKGDFSLERWMCLSAPTRFLSSPCQAWHEHGMRHVDWSGELSWHWRAGKRKRKRGHGAVVWTSGTSVWSLLSLTSLTVHPRHHLSLPTASFAAWLRAAGYHCHLLWSGERRLALPLALCQLLLL